MEEKRRNPKTPLLYIQQPVFQEPEVSMQSHYRGVAIPPVHVNEVMDRRPKEDSAEIIKEKKKRSKPEREEEFIFENKESSEQRVRETQVSSPPDNNNHTGKQQPLRGLTPVKPFPAMNLNEKLQYLFLTPRFYYCRFLTKSGEFVGKLYQIKEGVIVIESASGEYHMIQKEDLLDIKIRA